MESGYVEPKPGWRTGQPLSESSASVLSKLNRAASTKPLKRGNV